MNDVLMWLVLALPPMIAAQIVYRVVNRPKPVPVPEDPLVVEARRLAQEEVEELDWLSGTGPKPEHVIQAERAEEYRQMSQQDKIVGKIVKALSTPNEILSISGVPPLLTGRIYEPKNALGEVLYRYEEQEEPRTFKEAITLAEQLGRDDALKELTRAAHAEYVKTGKYPPRPRHPGTRSRGAG